MSQSSIIGAGTVVRGNIAGEGSLEIYGRVDGDVNMTGEVLVGDTGAVLGQINAGRISVSGAVQGDVRGTEAVLLERGAKVVGDLSAPRIGIANGALVRGTVRTEGEPALAQNRRGPALAAPAPKAEPAAFKSAPFVAKPVAKTEPKPPVVAQALAAAAPAPRPPEPERRPPPPVLPSLGKSARGKKKKDRDE
jgi:cytoskeletal protein CcmA (bactofilin family)